MRKRAYPVLKALTQDGVWRREILAALPLRNLQRGWFEPRTSRTQVERLYHCARTLLIAEQTMNRRKGMQTKPGFQEVLPDSKLQTEH